jgi:hypothetical protein
MIGSDRRVTAGVGLATWIVGLIALPMTASLQARILLLAPLVIVPQLLDALPRQALPVRVSGLIALVAALPLLGAMAATPGPIAAALALPWLGLTGALGVAAAWRGLRRLPGILAPARAPELGVLAACGFLGVSGLFLVFDRLAVQPGGFSADIILLTAVHFAFAGFGLLAVASMVAESRPAMAIPVYGFLFGIPLTAAGFVLGVMPLNALGATVTGLSGIVLAIGLLSDHGPAGRARRTAWKLAGLALLIGMPMGIAWSVSIALGSSFLDLDRMVRTHGALNSLAVLLIAVAAPLWQPHAQDQPHPG